MRIIYVKRDAFPEDLSDGVDDGSGIIFTRSFDTAKKIVSDGLPTIVLADNAFYAGTRASIFATILKREVVSNIIFFIISSGESVLMGPDVDAIVTMSPGFVVAGQPKLSMSGQLVRMARIFADPLVRKP